MGVHDGHRERMKELLRKNGIEAFPDHAVLELLLYCSIPRGDVNPLAHRLIERFGSLAGVFDAPEEDIASVEGVGEKTAYLIKLVPLVSRRYLMSRAYDNTIINSVGDAGDFLLPHFSGEQTETVYLVSMDAKCKVVNCTLIGHGDVNSAGISIRKLVATALNYGATYAILAHNHPSGIALPSDADIAVTAELQDALGRVDVTLLDHLIIADDDFVSLAENGALASPEVSGDVYKIG